MKEWLESIVKKLKEIPEDGSGKRLVSAFTIAYCFYQLYIPMHPKLDQFVVPLLQMLQLKPSKTKMCPEYELLCNVLPKEKRYIGVIIIHTNVYNL